MGWVNRVLRMPAPALLRAGALIVQGVLQGVFVSPVLIQDGRGQDRSLAQGEDKPVVEAGGVAEGRRYFRSEELERGAGWAGDLKIEGHWIATVLVVSPVPKVRGDFNSQARQISHVVADCVFQAGGAESKNRGVPAESVGEDVDDAVPIGVLAGVVV